MSIKDYIEYKRNGWSETTIRAEAYRLSALLPSIDGSPKTLLAALERYSPYTRVTNWIRVSEYWQFLIDTGRTNEKKNEYKEWKKANPKHFSGKYTKKVPDITFTEALQRIEGIGDKDVKNAAISILRNGLRFCESRTIADGTVIGKGNKSRRIFRQEAFNFVSYSRLYEGLKRVGLKVHDLRKIFLSRLVELGANPFELCEIAGWANLNTAQAYIRANPKRLKSLVEEVNI